MGEGFLLVGPAPEVGISVRRFEPAGTDAEVFYREEKLY